MRITPSQQLPFPHIPTSSIAPYRSVPSPPQTTSSLTPSPPIGSPAPHLSPHPILTSFITPSPHSLRSTPHISPPLSSLCLLPTRTSFLTPTLISPSPPVTPLNLNSLWLAVGMWAIGLQPRSTGRESSTTPMEICSEASGCRQTAIFPLRHLPFDVPPTPLLSTSHLLPCLFHLFPSVPPLSPPGGS